MSGADTESRQVLNKFIRDGEQEFEKSVVVSPGARAAAWPVKIESNSSYNIYNVRAVVLGPPGSSPVKIGQNIEATNLAESFTQSGQLAAGRYVVMFRMGSRNVFYAEA